MLHHIFTSVPAPILIGLGALLVIGLYGLMCQLSNKPKTEKPWKY